MIDVGWVAYNKKSGQLLHLSLTDGWEVDVVATVDDDLFGFMEGKIEPIEDEL